MPRLVEVQQVRRHGIGIAGTGFILQSPSIDMPVPSVLLFLKSPVPGYVKTRLANDVGDRAACAVFCSLVERQVAALPPGWPLEIHFAPADAEARIRSWIHGADRYLPQVEGDLGARLAAASENAFRQGTEPVFLIGADCPNLNPEDFYAALDSLASGCDAVFGPARDGGYYLLALKRHTPELFRQIPWSTSEVLKQSLDRAKQAEVQTALLEVKEDIDDISSLRRSQPTLTDLLLKNYRSMHKSLR